ncbi:MAG: hypothetical protein ACRCYT_06790 [Cetobacterium sp.]
MTVGEFIEKLKSVDGNSELEFLADGTFWEVEEIVENEKCKIYLEKSWG